MRTMLVGITFVCMMTFHGLWAAETDADGFTSLFNGKNLDGWIGATNGYTVEQGILICLPVKGGNLMSAQTYDNFVLRFEFRVYTNSNNGLGIRCPLSGRMSLDGIELQILDDSGAQYTNLQPYQYHGSIYGVVPAKRGHLKSVGQWNFQEVRTIGSRITVILNGAVIVDVDLANIKKTPDGKPHPGLHNPSGHIGWLGHGSRVDWRNIRIKEAGPDDTATKATTNTPSAGSETSFK